MSRDTTRVPTSVTVVKGKYTVRVYDEIAYAENIAQYHQEGQGTALPTTHEQEPKKPYKPFPKPYKWYGDRVKTA